MKTLLIVKHQRVLAPCDRLLSLLSPDGTGHGQERHEPAPARVHGDVLDEERPGRTDGDLQEADHAERQRQRQVCPLVDTLLRHTELVLYFSFLLNTGRFGGQSHRDV